MLKLCIAVKAGKVVVVEIDGFDLEKVQDLDGSSDFFENWTVQNINVDTEVNIFNDFHRQISVMRYNQHTNLLFVGGESKAFYIYDMSNIPVKGVNTPDKFNHIK